MGRLDIVIDGKFSRNAWCTLLPRNANKKALQDIFSTANTKTPRPKRRTTTHGLLRKEVLGYSNNPRSDIGQRIRIAQISLNTKVQERHKSLSTTGGIRYQGLHHHLRRARLLYRAHSSTVVKEPMKTDLQARLQVRPALIKRARRTWNRYT